MASTIALAMATRVKMDARRVVWISSAELSRSLEDRGYLGMSLTGQQANF
jgi:hypothetical protein